MRRDLRQTVVRLMLPLLAFMSGPAWAGSGAAGRITAVLPTNAGTVYFNQDGTRTGAPACSSSNPVRWVFADNSSAGQSMLAALLTAYSLGKSITITGTGACDIDSATESVAFFFLND